MSWADDLTRGFQAGSMMANTVMQGIRDQKQQERQDQMDALHMALLQQNNPGLHIADKSTVDGQPALKAQAVQPGTENDRVQAFGNGITYNPDEKARVDKEILRNKIAAQIEELQGTRAERLNDERAKGELENEILSNRPQELRPGSTIGTIAGLKRGEEGIHIPDRASNPQPYQFQKVGDKLMIFQPGSKDPVNTIDIPKGADVKSTSHGIFKEKTPGKGDYTLIEGTQPIEKGGDSLSLRRYGAALSSVKSYQKMLEANPDDEEAQVGLKASQMALDKASVESGLTDPGTVDSLKDEVKKDILEKKGAPKSSWFGLSKSGRTPEEEKAYQNLNQKRGSNPGGSDSKSYKSLNDFYN